MTLTTTAPNSTLPEPAPDTATISTSPVPPLEGEQRFLRNADVVDQDAINAATVCIVGCGAIGSHTAEMLAKLGVQRFILIDGDSVDTVNLSVQGFYEDEVGAMKVHAVADRIKRLRSDVEITLGEGHWLTKEDNGIKIPKDAIIFACVDSIDVRKDLFKAFIKGRAPVFFDARMTAETFQVYCIARDNGHAITEYQKTFFPKNEAYAESCTARATIYCAGWAAAALTGMFRKFAMRQKTGLYHWKFNFSIGMLDLVEAEEVMTT